MGLKLKRNSRSYVMLLCFMGIFAALQYVTEYHLSITIADKYRIAFTFLIRAITGYCIGWLGGIVSMITDILGGFLLYGGSMNPGITLTRFLQGFTVGIILYRKSTIDRVVIASVIDNLILSLFLNTYFIFTLYGTPYRVATLAPRAVIAVTSFVLEIVIMRIMQPRLIPAIRSLLYKGIWAEDADTAVAAVPLSGESVDDVPPEEIQE